MVHGKAEGMRKASKKRIKETFKKRRSEMQKRRAKLKGSKNGNKTK